MKKTVKTKTSEIINYIWVGILTTIVSLLVYYLFSFLINLRNPAFLQLANIISWICAVLFAYIMNRRIVFQSKNRKGLEFVKFTISRLSTLLIDMFSMFILVTILSIDDKLSKLFVQIIIFLLNYLFSKVFVFKKDSSNR